MLPCLHQLCHWYTAKHHCFGVLKGVQVVAEVLQPKYVCLANRQPKSLQKLLVLERLQDPGNLVRTVQLCMECMKRSVSPDHARINYAWHLL